MLVYEYYWSSAIVILLLYKFIKLDFIRSYLDKQTFVHFVKEDEFSLRWQSINCMYFKTVRACCFKVLLKQTVIALKKGWS